MTTIVNSSPDIEANIIQVMEERFGPQPEDSNGKPICGRAKHNAGQTPCENIPGYRTAHPGFGPCIFHGGERPGIDRRKNNHGRIAKVIKHDRLQQLILEEEAAGKVDNLDEEIVLAKALIKFTAEKFGETVPAIDKDGHMIQVDQTDLQSRMLIGMTKDVANLIAQKYKALQIGGMMIPREQVLQYVNEVALQLQRVLRNTCEKCQHQHGLRDKAVAALKLVENI